MPVSSACCSRLAATISEALCGQFTPLDQGGFRDLASTERREGLTGPRCGQQLSLVQIDGQRLQVRTMLDRCADRRGKAPQAGGVICGAPDRFDLMLVGQKANVRHIEHLTAFCDPAWDTAEVLTALRTDLGVVTDHFIWLLHQRERLPGVSRLTSWTLATGTTRTAGQTPQPVRRGWLTAGATVFGQIGGCTMIDNSTSAIYNAISNIDVFLYISILYDWGKYQWQHFYRPSSWAT